MQEGIRPLWRRAMSPLQLVQGATLCKQRGSEAPLAHRPISAYRLSIPHPTSFQLWPALQGLAPNGEMATPAEPAPRKASKRTIEEFILNRKSFQVVCSNTVFTAEVAVQRNQN